MATVIPVYGEQKASTSVAREAQASGLPASSFPGSEAPQLAAAANQMFERINTAAAEESLVKFEREKNEIFFNPETGYFNAQGRDAYDRSKPTIEQLEKLKRTYLDELPTDAAKQAFDRAAGQHITRAQQDVMRHASNGIRAWEVATINASVENTLENAHNYWSDSKHLGVQRELGRQAIRDGASLEGIDGEALNERLQTFESQFAANTIEAATVVSAADGTKAMERYGDRLEGPMRTKLTQKLQQKTEAEKAREDSRLAVLTGTRLVDEYGDQTNARELIMEQVNEIKDADLRKRTREEAMHQLNVKRTADSERRAEVFDNAQKFVMEGGSVDQFIADNGDAWHDLTAQQQSALRSGGQVQNDYVLLSNLKLLPPEKLAQVTPADYAGRLNGASLNQLTTAVKAARESKPDSQVGQARTTESLRMVEQIMNRQRGDWGKKHLPTANAIFALIDAEYEFRKSAKGSDLTSTEYTAMLNELALKTRKERFILPDKEVGLADIPAEEIGGLTDVLHRARIPATPPAMQFVRELRKTGIDTSPENLQASGQLGQLGIPVNRDNIEVAKFLMQNRIPVTAENMQKALEQARQ